MAQLLLLAAVVLFAVGAVIASGVGWTATVVTLLLVGLACFAAAGLVEAWPWPTRPPA